MAGPALAAKEQVASLRGALRSSQFRHRSSSVGEGRVSLSRVTLRFQKVWMLALLRQGFVPIQQLLTARRSELAALRLITGKLWSVSEPLKAVKSAFF